MIRQFGFVAALLAAAPSMAAAWTVNGFQLVADFEDVALGATESCDDGFVQCVSGGVVSEATGAFTARSGTRFMLGTSIGTPQYDVGVTLWPALGAWIQSASVVEVTFWGGVFGDLQLLATRHTSGSGNYEFIGLGNPVFDVPLLEMRMASGAAFAVDDVTFGLPEQVYGVPEPGTWALMIIGFGAVGSVLRSRRTLAAPA